MIESRSLYSSPRRPAADFGRDEKFYAAKSMSQETSETDLQFKRQNILFSTAYEECAERCSASIAAGREISASGLRGGDSNSVACKKYTYAGLPCKSFIFPKMKPLSLR